MSKVYIVWVSVEEYDTETGVGEELDLPFAFHRRFHGKRGHQNAVDYATALQAMKPLAWRGKGEKVSEEL